jgi:hypothetical protein
MFIKDPESGRRGNNHQNFRTSQWTRDEVSEITTVGKRMHEAKPADANAQRQETKPAS